LELHGGGIKVEGLTVLPPGRCFLELAFLSFGLLSPFEKQLVDEMELGGSERSQEKSNEE